MILNIKHLVIGNGNQSDTKVSTPEVKFIDLVVNGFQSLAIVPEFPTSTTSFHLCYYHCHSIEMTRVGQDFLVIILIILPPLLTPIMNGIHDWG